ncbi:MAG: hypothetical protein ACTHN5_17115 [Phycisphaerae bacterium]
MSEQSGENTPTPSFLRNTLISTAIAAAMIGAGTAAFFSVYHGPPPAPQITAGIVSPPASQPAARALAPVSPNPPLRYRAVLLNPDNTPAANVPYRVFRTGFVTPDTPVEAEGRTGADGSLTVGPFRREGDDSTHRLVVFDAPHAALAWWNVGDSELFPLHDQAAIHLRRALPVGGTVTDAKGAPVEGAVVESEAQTLNDNTYGDAAFTQQNGHAVKTDAHGHFEFDRVPEGTLLQLHVRDPHDACYSTGVLARGRYFPIPAGATDVAIQLQPPVTVHAQLTQNGKPLAKPNVWIYAFDRSRLQMGSWAKSDEHGKLEFAGLAEGRWEFLSPNFLTPDDALAVRRMAVLLKPGEERKLNLICEPPVVVTGVLKDPVTHQPLQQPQEIEVVSGLPGAMHVASGSQGKFTLRLPPGRARLRVQGWENGRVREVVSEVDVHPNAAPVEMAVHPRPVLRGQLFNDKGQPLEGRIVIGDEAVSTEADGRFAMPAPELNGPGKIGIATNHDQTLGTGFTFTVVDENQPLQLYAEPMATFTGQFIDDADHPVPAEVATHFSVRLPRGTAEADNALWKTTIAPDGRFRIGPVPAGFRLQLATNHLGEERYRRVPYYEGGHDTDLGHVHVCGKVGDRTFVRDASITGTLVDETGKPVVGLALETRLDDIPTAVTDFKGRFTLTHLPHDNDISLSATAGLYGTCDFSAHAGAKDVKLTMTPLGSELRDKPAPDLLTARWINKGSDKLADYRGKVVLLQTGVWLQSYPPQSEVGKLYEKTKETGFVLVSNNTAWGINRLQEIENWVKSSKVTWPCAIDATDDHTPGGHERHSEGATASLYASHHDASMLYLIDKKGVVRACPSGKDRDMEAWIRKLLGE